MTTALMRIRAIRECEACGQSACQTPRQHADWRTVTTFPLSLYMHAVRSRPHRQLSKGVVLPVRTAIWSRSSLRLPDVLRRRAYSVTRRAGPKRLETRMATPARACPQAVEPPSRAGSRWFRDRRPQSLCSAGWRSARRLALRECVSRDQPFEMDHHLTPSLLCNRIQRRTAAS